MSRDLTSHEVWVRERDDAVVGFLVVKRKVSPVLEILWLAVAPEMQGQGHGTALIGTLRDQARRDGIVALSVKTLAATVESPRYARTRAFYERLGFVLVEVIDPYPGWSPGNPCSLYIKIV
jgi:ribosomal protein S18 acetylase RimI-like enzyme